MKFTKVFLLFIFVLGIFVTFSTTIKDKNYFFGRPINVFVVPYLKTINDYYETCTQVCNYFIGYLDKRLKILRKIIWVSTDVSEDYTNLLHPRKEKFAELIGIDPYGCFLDDIINKCQNGGCIKDGDIFSNKFNFGLIINLNQNYCGVAGAVVELSKYSDDILRGHKQRIWLDVLENNNIFELAGFNGYKDFCEKVNENLLDATTIHDAEFLWYKFRRLKMILEQRCKNYVCKKSLEKFLYSDDKFCHNYFVEVFNKIRNLDLNKCGAEFKFKLKIIYNKEHNYHYNTSIESEIEINISQLKKIQTLLKNIDVNCAADLMCSENPCEKNTCVSVYSTNCVQSYCYENENFVKFQKLICGYIENNKPIQELIKQETNNEFDTELENVEKIKKMIGYRGNLNIPPEILKKIVIQNFLLNLLLGEGYQGYIDTINNKGGKILLWLEY